MSKMYKASFYIDGKFIGEAKVVNIPDGFFEPKPENDLQIPLSYGVKKLKGKIKILHNHPGVTIDIDHEEIKNR